MGGPMNKGILSPPANMRPPALQNVGIEQHLDAQVPPDLVFRDETGQVVKLGDYFGKKPLILDLVYYRCPMLCGESLAGLSSSMRLLKFDAGKNSTWSPSASILAKLRSSPPPRKLTTSSAMAALAPLRAGIS